MRATWDVRSSAVPIEPAGATATADAVRRGLRSAVDVVEEALERISRVDPDIGAFVLVDEDAARRSAIAIDDAVRAGHDPGPFAGVPVAVKDVEQVAGWPTRAGSRTTSAAVAPVDDPEIACLRSAGAVLVGKTSTGELGVGYTTASKLHEDTANPWHRGCSAGGSSGGSAAAVAAGMVALGTGTDSGGSVRVPAAFCALVGFKPSKGVVCGTGRDRAGLVEPGVLARSVADVVAWLGVVASSGLDERPGRPRTGGQRVAYLGDVDDVPVDHEVSALVERAAEKIVTVDRAEVPEIAAFAPDDLGLDVWAVLAGVELRGDLTRTGVWPDRMDDLSATLRGALRALDGVGPLDVVVCEGIRATLQSTARRIFEQIDVLVTPATTVVPPPRGGPFPPVIGGRDGAWAGPAPFSPIANLWGAPAVVVPAGMTRDRLPVGVQLIAAPGADRALLDVARRLTAEHADEGPG